MSSSSKPRLASSAALAATLLVASLCATPVLAQARSYAFAIPAKDLADALRDFGRASDRQLVFDERLVVGRTSPRLAGDLTAEDALAQLLAGTDLTWRATPTGAVMIVRRSAESPQVEAPALSAGIETLTEVEVVGSRFARTEDGPAPVTILDRDAIDDLGATNVADILRYVPQQSFSLNERSSPGGARRVQLRGLNAGASLILINGRRVVPGAVSGVYGYFDLNTIALSAVDRIEVLADSASAVYGADAVGGVINIVMKSVIAQPVLDLYAGRADGGADERRVSLSVGGRSARAQGVMTIDYFKRETLLGAARPYVADGDYRRFGGIDRRVTAANPGNVCTLSGLILPGLGAPCAAVPSVGRLSPTRPGVVPGAQNLDTLEAYRAIVPPSERYSAWASGSLELTDQISAYGEFLYADRTDRNIQSPAVLSRVTVPTTNAFNSFGVPVRADFLLTALGPSVITSHETSYRTVAGLKGRVGNWNWDLSALSSRSDADYATTNMLDPLGVAAALAASDPTQALNIFEAGSGGSRAVLASLVLDAQASQTAFASRSSQIGGFVRGDLVRLPAGDLQVVAGGEWRRESISVQQPSTGFAVNASVAKRTSSSAYVELRAPLLAEAPGATILQNLAVTVAARHDSYSDFGNTLNAQYGLEWRPMPTLLVRASYGDSFRAPGLFDLFQPQSGPYSSPFFDPRRGAESVVATYMTGGNLDLEPERSSSVSFGSVWTPDLVGRPRLTVSFWRIEQDQRILSFVSPTSVLANEAYYPGRVVRAAPTAADLAAGRPGRITSIDARLLNLGRLETHGVDLEATARFDTGLGRFSPRLAATRIGSYKAADFPITPMTERVGIASSSGTVPRWRAVGAMTWSKAGVSLTATARYTNAYDDARGGVRNGVRVPSQVLVDAQAAFDLGELSSDLDVAKGLVVRIGATNLFDKAPAFSDVIGYGYDPSQGDARQRFLYASISKSF